MSAKITGLGVFTTIAAGLSYQQLCCSDCTFWLIAYYGMKLTAREWIDALPALTLLEAIDIHLQSLFRSVSNASHYYFIARTLYKLLSECIPCMQPWLQATCDTFNLCVREYSVS